MRKIWCNFQFYHLSGRVLLAGIDMFHLYQEGYTQRPIGLHILANGVFYLFSLKGVGKLTPPLTSWDTSQQHKWLGFYSEVCYLCICTLNSHLMLPSSHFTRQIATSNLSKAMSCHGSSECMFCQELSALPWSHRITHSGSEASPDMPNILKAERCDYGL